MTKNKKNIVELPPDSEITISVHRLSEEHPDIFTIQLLVNGKVFGDTTYDELEQGGELVGFKTPSTGKTIKFQLSENFKIDFGIIKSIFGGND